MLSSLDKLSKSFLKDSPELQKFDNEEYLRYLMDDEHRNNLDSLKHIDILSKIIDYYFLAKQILFYFFSILQK